MAPNNSGVTTKGYFGPQCVVEESAENSSMLQHRTWYEDRRGRVERQRGLATGSAVAMCTRIPSLTSVRDPLLEGVRISGEKVVRGAIYARFIPLEPLPGRIDLVDDTLQGDERARAARRCQVVQKYRSLCVHVL